MSFIYRDASLIPRARLNQFNAAYNHFHRFWATKTIKDSNGKSIRVYVHNMNFYTGSFIQNTTIKKFVKSIGFSWKDFISQDVDSDIRTMYFKLKSDYVWNGRLAYSDFSQRETPTKPKRLPTRKEIADLINANLVVGKELKTTISYGGVAARYIKEHTLTWGIDESGIIQKSQLNTKVIRSVIASNPWYYLVNSRHMPYVKDTYPAAEYDGTDKVLQTFFKTADRKLPPCDVYAEDSLYGILALLGDKHSFEQEVDANGESVVYAERISPSNVDGKIFVEYDYSYSYIFKGVNEDSIVVRQIADWFSHYKQDLSDIKYNPTSPDRYKEELTTSMIDTKFKKLFISMVPLPNNGNGIYEDSLYLYTGGDVYLKVDAVKRMKRSDFVKMLAKNLDTDYTVKKKKWWEVVLFIALIIISVVISVLTAGAGAPVTAAWLATFTGVLSVSLTISGMILSEVAGLSANGLVKVVGKFAQISGYIALVAGITAAYQSFTAKVANAKDLATGGSGQLTGDALKVAMKEVSITDMANYAVDTVKDKVMNIFTSSSTMTTQEAVSYIGDGIKAVKKVNDYMVDKEMKELKKDEAELNKEMEEWNQSLSSNVFKNGSVWLSMEMSRVSEYDAISNIDLIKYNNSATSFKTDDSYNWYIGVNS